MVGQKSVVYFVLFHSSFLVTFINAAEKINIGIIDYPDNRWRSIAREQVTIRGMSLKVKDMAFQPPISIKHALEVEQFVKTENVSVLIGRDLNLVTLMSSELSIPYIVTEENHLLADVNMFEQPDMVMTMYPGPKSIKNLLEDLIVYFRLEDIYMIYDTESGHNLIGYLLSKSSITIRALQVDALTDDNHLLQEMIAFRNLGRRTIMLLIHPSNIPRVLDTAMKLSLLVPVYHWIVVTLDARVINFNPWVDSGMNVTMFQLSHEDEGSKRVELQDALLIDALTVVNSAVNSGGDMRKKRDTKGLKEIIQNIKVNGLTGPIEFDKKGFRKNLLLDIVGLNEKGIHKKGVWLERGATVKDRIKLHKSRNTNGLGVDDEASPLGRATVKVVSILEEPFLMLKKGNTSSKGNDRYEGYCVDLLEELAKLVKFDYAIYLTPDNKFGTADDDGNWDGMISELMAGNASMAVSSLIISSARESVVDFTKPFKAVDMNVLIARPKEKSNLLQFMDPLHWSVWISIAVAVGVFGVALTMIDRLNPNDEFDAEQPRFSLSESMWFFYATLAGAGTEATPQILSARILTSFWWFFSLIIVSSYTANMAAFLTMSQISSPIDGILSLQEQNEVKYGTTTGSRAAEFFQRSNRDTFTNMWLAMRAGNMVESTEVAIDKVINENYAYIWDAPVNNYIATTNCRTLAVGGSFNRQGYGIGVPRGATYRDVLTIAILTLNEQGVLHQLEQKYWGFSKCASLKAAKSKGDTTELEIQNVAGIFIILFCGIVIAVIVCITEYFWRRKKQRSTDIHPKGSTIEDKWEELIEKRKIQDSSL